MQDARSCAQRPAGGGVGEGCMRMLQRGLGCAERCMRALSGESHPCCCCCCCCWGDSCSETSYWLPPCCCCCGLPRPACCCCCCETKPCAAHPAGWVAAAYHDITGMQSGACLSTGTSQGDGLEWAAHCRHAGRRNTASDAVSKRAAPTCCMGGACPGWKSGSERLRIMSSQDRLLYCPPWWQRHQQAPHQRCRAAPHRQQSRRSPIKGARAGVNAVMSRLPRQTCISEAMRCCSRCACVCPACG